MSDTSIIGLNLADRFRITGVIGEGGMATVYRGIEKGKSTELAVKIMNPDLAKESRFVRRFRREAKAASMLKHPNTVQIVEFGVDQGYVFMVMELLLGQDLAMLLHRERKIPEARAAQIAVQVCRALSAAHEQSIVHRDLKPDNIMLVRHPPSAPLPVVGMNPGDFVKVLDFGIAKILDDEPGTPADSRIEPITQEKSMLTRVGTIVGTPAYMAPEQGRAEAVDARTDIYAVGVLLYELITGRVPFTGETPMQVVMRHVNEPPRPPSDFHPVSRDLERLIMRALAKWPSERQQSAEELAFDLLGVLPKLTGGAPTKPAENVQKTLVMDPGPPPAAAPRPAAGMPPAGRSPAAPALASLPSRGPAPQAAASMNVHSGDAANPFPTLNIEVPDDIFPPDLPVVPVAGRPDRAPLTASAATARPLPSTDPSPTHRTETSANRGGMGPSPAAASVQGRAPVARPQPEVPVVAAGGARGAALAQTLQSEAPPPPSTDDDEGATLVKSPTEADKARMSLAEEAMAKALAGAPPPRAAVGVGVPKMTDPESVEPTLIQGATGSPGGRPKDGPVNLRTLQETVRVDPSETEKAVKDAVARRAIPQPAPSPIPLASVPPGASGPANAATLALDEPPKVGATTGSNRKPTSELLPVSLPEERASSRPEVGEAALWKPKASRKLGGAAALLIGILIGTVLVATALIVAISLRR